MAFSTYADLQSTVADQLARGDLTSQIPDFILLFEKEAGRTLFRLRPTETSATLTVASGAASLPSDYMGWRYLKYTGSPTASLRYIPPAELIRLYSTNADGLPIDFTIEGGTIKIRPITDGTDYSLGYFARTGALSSALNWLFTNHPDAYFFGSLEQAYLFVEDPENAAIWATKKSAVFSDIKLQHFREHGALEIRASGPTP